MSRAVRVCAGRDRRTARGGQAAQCEAFGDQLMLEGYLRVDLADLPPAQLEIWARGPCVVKE